LRAVTNHSRRVEITRRGDAKSLCEPGDTIEIIGLGAVTINPSGVKSTVGAVRARGVRRTGFTG
jgi:hypothetical protein